MSLLPFSTKKHNGFTESCYVSFFFLFVSIFLVWIVVIVPAIMLFHGVIVSVLSGGIRWLWLRWKEESEEGYG